MKEQKNQRQAEMKKKKQQEQEEEKIMLEMELQRLKEEHQLDEAKRKAEEATINELYENDSEAPSAQYQRISSRLSSLRKQEINGIYDDDDFPPPPPPIEEEQQVSKPVSNPLTSEEIEDNEALAKQKALFEYKKELEIKRLDLEFRQNKLNEQNINQNGVSAERSRSSTARSLKLDKPLSISSPGSSLGKTTGVGWSRASPSGVFEDETASLIAKERAAGNLMDSSELFPPIEKPIVNQRKPTNIPFLTDKDKISSDPNLFLMSSKDKKELKKKKNKKRRKSSTCSNYFCSICCQSYSSCRLQTRRITC